MNPILETIATCVTTIGVVFLGVQIHLSKKQDQVQFEDNMAKEYRSLIKSIPAKVLMGEEMAIDEAVQESIYNYIDLSNQQIFLRMNGRVSRQTWIFWCDGMKENLQLPEFKKAWERIKKEAPNSFAELRKLEEGFVTDPKKW